MTPSEYFRISLDGWTYNLEMAQQTLQQDRPFLTPEEIAEDLKQIAEQEAEIEKETQLCRDLGADAWEIHHATKRRASITEYRDKETEWCTPQGYKRLIREWCIRSRQHVHRMYRIHGPKLARKQMVNDRSHYRACPRCDRFFTYEGSNQSYMMSAHVGYDFSQNMWFVAGGYGSVIADNNNFVVEVPLKMGTLLRRRNVFCDFCLVDMVENGALRAVFIQSVVIDWQLFRRLRGTSPQATWI